MRMDMCKEIVMKICMDVDVDMCIEISTCMYIDFRGQRSRARDQEASGARGHGA